MQQALARISRRESRRLGTQVQARIGINSGKMIAGNVGTDRHFNYTVLGASVKLAAQLESLNNAYGTSIMAGASVVADLPDELQARYLDTVSVDGRKNPIDIYELVGQTETLSYLQKDSLTAYSNGIKYYRARRWVEAGEHFAAGLAANPKDGPCPRHA